MTFIWVNKHVLWTILTFVELCPGLSRTKGNYPFDSIDLQISYSLCTMMHSSSMHWQGAAQLEGIQNNKCSYNHIFLLCWYLHAGINCSGNFYFRLNNAVILWTQKSESVSYFPIQSPAPSSAPTLHPSGPLYPLPSSLQKSCTFQLFRRSPQVFLWQRRKRKVEPRILFWTPFLRVPLELGSKVSEPLEISNLLSTKEIH